MTEQETSRQYVRYAFYRIVPEWRRRSPEERCADKQSSLAVLEQFAQRMVVLRTYSTVGTRGDCDFMLWSVSEQLEDFTELSSAVNTCRLGPYLETAHSFLGMTKRSMYIDEHRHPGQEGSRTRIKPGTARYLFVYPFWKTRPWYQLPPGERQAMMNEHIRVGHKYPSVKINTSYSFGLDDQEFVVAFETDSPSDFLDLVMELRESAASSYTLRDTPIFTCIWMKPADVLDAIG
jgi:chlorite dismutase